jgi:hypothetical protein
LRLSIIKTKRSKLLIADKKLKDREYLKATLYHREEKYG